MQVSMEDGNYVFGEASGKTTSDYLPKNSNTWQVGPKLPGDYIWHGCVVRISNEEFVVLGGVDSYRYTSNKMIKYNTRTKSWTKNWGNLVQGREHGHGCTYVDGNIIVAGGWGEGGWLRSTEIISVATGVSRLVGDMHEKRHLFALVTVGKGQSQRVLAIGGTNGNYSLSSVEIFDGQAGTWSLAPFSMEEPRKVMAYLSIADDLCAG